MGTPRWVLPGRTLQYFRFKSGCFLFRWKFRIFSSKSDRLANSSNAEDATHSERICGSLHKGNLGALKVVMFETNSYAEANDVLLKRDTTSAWWTWWTPRPPCSQVSSDLFSFRIFEFNYKICSVFVRMSRYLLQVSLSIVFFQISGGSQCTLQKFAAHFKKI